MIPVGAHLCVRPLGGMRSPGGHAGPPLHAHEHEHAFRIRSIRAYINARNRIEFVHGNFFLLLSPQRAKIHDTAAHSAQASVRIRLTMLAFTGGQSCRSAILAARFPLAKYEFVNCLTRVSAGLSFADEASANWGIHILI